jgi:D-glycero-D-manno-heptose 1,7-bisphosphate phosphatase
VGIGGLSRRAVFLDRDGVLNKAVVRDGKPYPPDSLAELEIFPEARAQLERLRQAGFLLLVVTNQPDVARGTRSLAVVESIHSALRSALPLDDFFVCSHDDGDRCDCRKPLPGLLLRAAEKYGVDLFRSFLIGDRWRDVEAGANAGCATVWIDYGYRERPPAVEPWARVNSLTAAVEQILGS